MLIRFAYTESAHPDGRVILQILRAGKSVQVLSSSQRAGDYSVKTSHGQTIGFEYVNAAGFYTDLVTRRLDFKMANLVLDYDVRILIVSGRLEETHDGYTIVDGWSVHKFAWGNVERKLARYGHAGISIHMVRSPHHAANLILRLARSLEKHPLEPLGQQLALPPPVAPLGVQDAQARLLTEFPMIGGKRARDVLQFCGTLRGALGWITRDKDAMTGIPGIGSSARKAIQKFLDASRDEAPLV